MLDTLKSLRFRAARYALAIPGFSRLVAGMPTGRTIPDHVPRELVREVDIYNLPGAAESVHRAWKRVQDENPDLFWTPFYGGHWVLARAELIATVFPDYERFPSSNSIGIPMLPKSAPPMLPIASDPPDHKAFRHPLNLALSPKAIQAFSAEARALAIELIDGFRSRGECEFMTQFAGFLPMTIFLRMVDLPMSDREYLIRLTEHMVRGGDDRMRYGLEVFEYLDRWVAKRRRNPGKDLISQIVTLKVGDRTLTHHEALGEAAQVLFGGLDTVAGTMGFIAHHLARHPEHRRELAGNPALIPGAIEEMIRRHSIPNIARRVASDLEFGGVRMRKDDQVMIPICLHGLDERAWNEPLSVDVSRRTTEHVGFGKGVHKCPGANLARLEIRIFLEEWLQRIPEFSVKAGVTPVNLPGQVMGIKDLWLQWPTRTVH